MPKKAMRAPIPAKSAPNQKAMENPWLSAFVLDQWLMAVRADESRRC